MRVCADISWTASARRVLRLGRACASLWPRWSRATQFFLLHVLRDGPGRFGDGRLGQAGGVASAGVSVAPAAGAAEPNSGTTRAVLRVDGHAHDAPRRRKRRRGDSSFKDPVAAVGAARPETAEGVAPPAEVQPTPVTTSATTSWEAVGGCKEAMQALKEVVLLPLLYPQILATLFRAQRVSCSTALRSLARRCARGVLADIKYPST